MTPETPTTIYQTSVIFATRRVTVVTPGPTGPVTAVVNTTVPAFATVTPIVGGGPAKGVTPPGGGQPFGTAPTTPGTTPGNTPRPFGTPTTPYGQGTPITPLATGTINLKTAPPVFATGTAPPPLTTLQTRLSPNAQGGQGQEAGGGKPPDNNMKMGGGVGGARPGYAPPPRRNKYF